MADNIALSKIKTILIHEIAKDIVAYINLEVKNNCNGCYFNHSSQREHTCLGMNYDLSEFNFIDEYFESVYNEKQGFILQKLEESLHVNRQYALKVYISEKAEILTGVKNHASG